MRHAQALVTLLLLGCQRPTGSFVLPPTQGFSKGNRRARASAEHEHAWSMELELECRALKRRHVLQESAINRRTRSSGVVVPAHRNLASNNRGSMASKAARLRGKGEPVAETAAVPATQSPQSDEALSLFSGDGVSCLLNPGSGSRVVLVGVVHGKEQSAELAENVVREVKPDVVMLELDADRLDDLPPGRARKTEDGLSWFIPDEMLDEADSPSAAGDTLATIAEAKGRGGAFSFVSAQAARLLKGAMDALEKAFPESEWEDVSEMESAVRQAQACGARVCLGDRGFEETKRRLVEAGLADSVDDERLDDPEALLGSSMSASGRRKFASFNLKRPETRETAREYYDVLETVCDPRALSAMIKERDEVMANNLMALGGEQSTIVALLGIFHVDGIERILMDNGW